MPSTSSKARNALIAGVAAGSAGWLAWRAHRAARDALAGSLLGVIVEPPPVTPGGGELPFDPWGNLLDGLPPVPSGQPHPSGGDPGWPGLLHYLDEVNPISHPERWPTLEVDWNRIGEVTTWGLQEFSGFIELEWDALGTMLNFFGAAWGTLGDLASAFIQGTAQYAAELLGLATTETVHQLASWVYAHVDKLRDQLNGLSHRVRDLWDAVTEVSKVAQRALDLGLDLGGTVAARFQYLTTLVLGTFQDVYARLDQLEENLGQIAAPEVQLITDTVTQLLPGVVTVLMPQTIVDVFPLVSTVIYANVIQQLLAGPEITNLIQLQLQPVTQEITNVSQKADAAQECCDATRGQLPDLTGLLLTGTYAELLAAVEGFTGGAGGMGVESTLAGWLGL